MEENIDKKPYFTWGCSDDLAFRLKKTLYCGEDDGCYDASSAALTDVAVSMLRNGAKNSRRKLTQRYASSLTRQLSISPCALMMSILYTERLRQLNPGYLDRISSSDLYVVSMLVATKFLHDEGEQEEIYNDDWAEAAGLAVTTVNRLEREFLDAMDWRIYVNPHEFLAFCSKIETRIAFKYGLQRGWFSYTDLTQCLLAVQYQNVLKDIFEKTVKVIGGCVLVYGMSLSLIISSVITYSATCHANSYNNHINRPTSNFSRAAPLRTTSPITRAHFTDYSERSLTRRRSRRHQLSSDQNTGTDFEEYLVESGSDVAVMERLENSTESNIIGNILDSRTTCTSDTPPLRFESRFQHKTRQTEISISFDLKDLRRTFRGSEWGIDEFVDGCDIGNHAKQSLKKSREPFGHYFQRGTKHFISNTRLLGMPVI